MWDNITRLKEKGGKFELTEPRTGTSPWPVLRDGVRIFAFDINDDVFLFDPANPYKCTYRIITSKAPIIHGACAILEIIKCEYESMGYFWDYGTMDTMLPNFVLNWLFRKLILGPLLKRKDREFLDGSWEHKYTGLIPPPACTTSIASP